MTARSPRPSRRLTESDYDSLESAFITREMAQDAGLYRVDSEEGARLVGRLPDANHDYSGVVFPYRWPGNSQVREYRLRRDWPDEELQPDGEMKDRGKYLGPPNRPSLLYFAPDADPAWLSDTAMPIVVVEGEKKTLAMSRAARFESEAARFMPVGLAGAWNWKRQAPYTRADGARGKRSEPIGDLERVNWKGRTVFLLFDSNTAYNQSVATAREQLAYWLRSWGAKVSVVSLPAAEGVNGPDDYLATFGERALLELLEESASNLDEEALTPQEKFALRDYAQLSDIASVMMACWGFDEQDRETYRAFNAVWGGRRWRTFRASLLTIYGRLFPYADGEFQGSTPKKKAERTVRERRNKLLASINERISAPILSMIEVGGQVNPNTSKRLPAKYRISHAPFLEAYRLAQDLLRRGETSNPGRAREIAARQVAARYLLKPAEQKERKQRAERTPEDAAAAQVKFEKWMSKKAVKLAERMQDEGAGTADVVTYFRTVGQRMLEFAQTISDKAKRKRRSDQYITSRNGECMDTSERTHDLALFTDSQKQGETLQESLSLTRERLLDQVDEVVFGNL